MLCYLSEQLQLLAFAGAVINSLPYEDDEPLQIVSFLSRLVNTHGAKLQESLEATVRAINRKARAASAASAAQQGEDAQQSRQADEKDMTAAEQKRDRLVEELAAWPDKELHARLERECQAAMAVCILLATKATLQAAYGLTSDQCNDYHLNVHTGPAKRVRALLACSQRDSLWYCVCRRQRNACASNSFVCLSSPSRSLSTSKKRSVFPFHIFYACLQVKAEELEVESKSKAKTPKAKGGKAPKTPKKAVPEEDEASTALPYVQRLQYQFVSASSRIAGSESLLAVQGAHGRRFAFAAISFSRRQEAVRRGDHAV